MTTDYRSMASSFQTPEGRVVVLYRDYSGNSIPQWKLYAKWLEKPDGRRVDLMKA